MSNQFKQIVELAEERKAIKRGDNLSTENVFEIENESGNITTIRILINRKTIKIYNSKGEIINIFTYNKNIDDSIINKISKVFVDTNAFDTIKEARRYFIKRNLLEEIIKLKDSLDINYEVKSSLPELGTILKIDNYSDNVKIFFNKQPFFYDKSKIFWMWNLEQFCWEIVDETDVLIKIDEELKFAGQLVSSKVKGNYLEAFKQVGRKNMPEDAPKTWIQFKNKIFDTKSKKIFESTPKYFTCNPIGYDIGETSDTPVMDSLFESWVGKDFVQTLYEIIAYSCIPDYPIHLMFCLVGCGRNGKSQFQKIISNFFGSLNICSTELDLLIDNRFESAKLYKKLVCTLGETNFGVMSKTSLLKKLTGGDLIGYEFKNKMPFDDVNYAKIIINSNALPTSTDTSDGFYRRWLIIDFPNEFPEGKDIIETIPAEEYNNLARKVIEILPKLLDKGKFNKQGSIDERRKAYIMASNPLPFFIENCCYKDVNSFVRTNELFNAFAQFLIQKKKRVVSRKEFYQALMEEGLESRKTRKKINGEFVQDNYIDYLKIRGDLWDGKSFSLFSPFSPKSSLSSLGEGKSSEKQRKRRKKRKDIIEEEIDELFVPLTEKKDIRIYISENNNPINIEELKENLCLKNDDLIDKMLKEGDLMLSKPGHVRLP